MSGTSIEDLAAAADRRRRALVWGFVLAAFLLAVLAVLEFGGMGAVGVGLLLLPFSLEFFTLGGTVVYETTKSPEAVRSEFTGPQPPLFALHRHMPDRVTELDRGFAWERSGWIRTVSGRIEAAETDGPLELRIFEGEEHVRTMTVRVEPHGSVTRVTASVEREASAVLLALNRLMDPIQRRAMAAQGYVRVQDETSVW